MNGQSQGLPAGFRDLLFEEAEGRRRMESTLAEVFRSGRYREIVPSGIEFLDVYTRGNQVISERAFKFLDRDDRLLSLRADFTPAVARIVSSRLSGAGETFRIWYSGDVFRRVEPRKGGYAEFWQVGAELIGRNGPEHDCEVINLALECLTAIGIQDAAVHINHAGIFRGILNSLHLTDAARGRLKSEIDRKDARALATHLDDLGVAGHIGEQVRVLSRCIGTPDVLMDAAAVLEDGESQMAITHLKDVAAGLERWRDRITFDLTEIDELEYYTGVMFAFFSPTRRSTLGMGGRYDALLRAFGSDLPAVGFSLSMDSVMEGI